MKSLYRRWRQRNNVTARQAVLMMFNVMAPPDTPIRNEAFFIAVSWVENKSSPSALLSREHLRSFFLGEKGISAWDNDRLARFFNRYKLPMTATELLVGIDILGPEFVITCLNEAFAEAGFEVRQRAQYETLATWIFARSEAFGPNPFEW